MQGDDVEENTKGPIDKNRLILFGAGASVGLFLSVILLSYGFRQISEQKPTMVPVVVSKCDVKAGEELRKSCAEVRKVADQYLPPKVLLAKDLEWHLGRKLVVEVKKGSAFRTVDFVAPTSEGYIR